MNRTLKLKSDLLSVNDDLIINKLKQDFSTSNISINDAINNLFDLLNQNDPNILNKFFNENFKNIPSDHQLFEKLAEFIVDKIDFLMKRINSVNQQNSHGIVSILTILFQLIRKFFNPVILEPYYVKFVGYFRITRMIFNSILSYLS